MPPALIGRSTAPSFSDEIKFRHNKMKLTRWEIGGTSRLPRRHSNADFAAGALAASRGRPCQALAKEVGRLTLTCARFLRVSRICSQRRPCRYERTRAVPHASGRADLNRKIATMRWYLYNHERLTDHHQTSDLPAKARGLLFFLCSNRTAERDLS